MIGKSHFVGLPSGKRLHSLLKMPIEIVSFPIKHCDFPVRNILTFTRG